MLYYKLIKSLGVGEGTLAICLDCRERDLESSYDNVMRVLNDRRVNTFTFQLR